MPKRKGSGVVEASTCAICRSSASLPRRYPSAAEFAEDIQRYLEGRPIRARKPSLALLDIWMQGGGMDGLELIRQVRALAPDVVWVSRERLAGALDFIRGRRRGM